MRVSNVGLNTDLRNIHPGYLDYIPKQPRRRPKEQPFIFPELPKKSPLDELRSKIPEIRTHHIEILQRACATGLILLGLFMIGQIIYEFLNEPPRLPQKIRVVAPPKLTAPAPSIRLAEIEKKFEAIASVLEYLVNQQRLTASAPTGQSSSTYVTELRPPVEQPQDLQVVEVNVNKANLRVGPGLEHSPLMTVARHTRLAVEIEENGWYRVVAPNGERVWISKQVVTRS